MGILAILEPLMNQLLNNQRGPAESIIILRNARTASGLFNLRVHVTGDLGS